MENEIYEMSHGQCLIGRCIAIYFFDEWKEGVEVLKPGYIKSQLSKVYDKYPHANFEKSVLRKQSQEKQAVDYGISELKYKIALTTDPDYTREEADAWIS